MSWGISQWRNHQFSNFVYFLKTGFLQIIFISIDFFSPLRKFRYKFPRNETYFWLACSEGSFKTSFCLWHPKSIKIFSFGKFHFFFVCPHFKKCFAAFKFFQKNLSRFFNEKNLSSSRNPLNFQHFFNNFFSQIYHFFSTLKNFSIFSFSKFWEFFFLQQNTHPENFSILIFRSH